MAAAIVVGLMALAYYVLIVQPAQGSDTVQDLGGQEDMTADSATVSIARAIGVAEGGYDSAGNNLNNGSRPSRNHNPGDMTADLVGTSTGTDGPFVVYSNDSDGWQNLYIQVNAWRDGTSAHANADSTIYDISRFYTTTDQDAWANTVASVLGVTTDTPIGQVA